MYGYIAIFYQKFGIIGPLDPKDLGSNIIYEIILLLQLLAFFLIIITLLAWITSCIIKRNIIINRLVLLSFLNGLCFLTLYYFDFGNLQSWFFD